MRYCTNTEWRTIVYGCENIVLHVLYLTCLFVYTYSVFVFFFRGETTKESKINDVESMLGTPANDPPKTMGAIVLKTETKSSRTDHNTHLSVFCSQAQGA